MLIQKEVYSIQMLHDPFNPRFGNVLFNQCQIHSTSDQITFFLYQNVPVLEASSSNSHVRQKRAWIIDSFTIEEEHKGPFPYPLGNVRFPGHNFHFLFRWFKLHKLLKANNYRTSRARLPSRVCSCWTCPLRSAFNVTTLCTSFSMERGSTKSRRTSSKSIQIRG